MLRPCERTLRAHVYGLIGEQERLQYGIEYSTCTESGKHDESQAKDAVEHISKRHRRLIRVAHKTETAWKK